jgi:hypothetical protein
MKLSDNTMPNGWLAFELSILRRLKFGSVAIPFTGEPELGHYLKRWNVSVAANDLARWANTKATALIENNSTRLADAEVEMILQDAYVPGHEMRNPALLNWFNETDAWWFDNVRERAEAFESPFERALALALGMTVGDYVLSFDEETRHLRQPLALSNVFYRAWQSQPAPVNNSQRNLSENQEAREFVAHRQHIDLLFIRLPHPRTQPEQSRRTLATWREEWIRGGDNFWNEFETQRAGRLGSRVATKQQYLRFVEDLLHTAAHIPTWAIAHIENGFISTAELIETVSRIRKVEAIYTKDFTEMTGARAAIITA